MEKVYVLPDSNVLMHFTHWQDYPWGSHPEFQGKAVVLLFAAPVVEELDRNKDTNARNAIQNRCRALLGWMERELGGRKGAELEVRADLWCALDMQRYLGHMGKTPDERLIEYAAERPSGVVVFSNDFTVRLHARERDMVAVEPLQSERLPDEEGQEIQQLRRKVQEYENRKPQLRLHAPQGVVRFKLQTLPVTVDEFVTERVEAHRRGRGKLAGEPLEKFLADMAGYARFAYETYKRVLNSARFDLNICNEGNAPARSLKMVVTPGANGRVEEPLVGLNLPEQPEAPAVSDDRYIGLRSPYPPLKPGGSRRATPEWTYDVRDSGASLLVNRLLPKEDVWLPELAVSALQFGTDLTNQQVTVQVLYEEALEPATFNFGVVVSDEAEPLWEADQAYEELLRAVETYDEMFKRMGM